MPSITDDPAFQQLPLDLRKRIAAIEAEAIAEIEQLTRGMPVEIAQYFTWMTSLPGRFIRGQMPIYKQLAEYEELAARVGLGLMNKSQNVN
jgi:hypothetical protein